MKNINKTKLPVYWTANKKAWVTTKIFEDWFQNIFAKESETYIKSKNLDFKILLLVDNAPCHPKNLEHANIKVLFLPPNTTSLLQPLDQGIISTFKSYYIKKSLKLILDLIEEKPNLTLSELWKQFSILDCVNITSQSIKELKTSTLNGCWKKLWPEVVSNTNIENQLSSEISEIVDLVESSELFENLNEGDVLEMINDAPELTEQDLIQLAEEWDESTEDECIQVIGTSFESSKLKTLFDMAQEIINFSAENDPLAKRSASFECSIKNSLAPYEELFKQIEMEKKQKRITDYFGGKNSKD